MMAMVVVMMAMVVVMMVVEVIMTMKLIVTSHDHNTNHMSSHMHDH